MNTFLIRLIKIILLLATTCGLILWFLSVSLFLFWNERFKINVAWKPRKLYARLVCLILGLRFNLKNSPPKNPLFFVGNHVSYLDIFVYSSFVRSFFIAKKEIRKWFVIGWLVMLANTLFVDRSKRGDIKIMLEALKKKIKRGEGVIFFPEGKTTNGETIAPLRGALLEITCETKIPVWFGVLKYTCSDRKYDARTDVAWHGGSPFFKHFYRLLGQKRVNVSLFFSQKPLLCSEGRKTLIKKLEKDMQKSLKKIS